tara:strand:- start:2086 stop:3129 length:1044 start_codon:yes stop_codon:yes gene_type:complete
LEEKLTPEISFTEAEPNLKVFIADEDASGRLDVWLSKLMAPDFSRNRIKGLIEEGAVCINDIEVHEPKKKMQPDMEVKVRIPDLAAADPQGEDIALNIVFEDEHLIVVNKPAGLVVHPGAGNGTGTLVNALIHHCGDTLSGIGGVKRPGIVHRLDKDTSGVMVVAKNDNAHRHLSAQFADHGKTGVLERAYLAIVWGTPNVRNSKIATHLGRSNDRLKRAVRPSGAPDAKHAVTHYTLQNSFGLQDDSTALASLVECRLETGRTHQIRVHMAHISHPLVGDHTYGASFKTKANKIPEPHQATVKNFPRQALHAWLLQFEHPVTGEVKRFETEMPLDMQQLVTAFEQI